MSSFLVNSLTRYLSPHEIPLYVEEVPAGEHPPLQFHGHTFVEIVLVLAGNGVHLAGDAAAEIQTGDVLLIYPGISHCYDHTETLGIINIVYDPIQLSLPLLDGNRMPLFQRFMETGGLKSPEQVVTPLLRLSTEERTRIELRIKDLAAELNSDHPGRMFLGLALFMEILTELCRSETATAIQPDTEYLVGDAIRFMHNNLQNNIAVENLPELVHMSRRSFFRRFRNATGKTPAEYLKELRLAKAVELLQNSDLSINEIAVRCGFCSGNYVCRLFRERLGTSPGKFRKSR